MCGASKEQLGRAVVPARKHQESDVLTFNRNIWLGMSRQVLEGVLALSTIRTSEELPDPSRSVIQ